jgi:hypothetical protein
MEVIMRLLITGSIATILILSSLYAVDPPKSRSSSVCLENIAVDFENGTLVITPRSGENFKVEITDNDELFVNGRKISTSSEERELLGEYRHDMSYLVHRAEEIGIEGARIGLYAVSGLIEVVCTDLELEELEAELESESSRLENEAEELEELSTRLEDLHNELKDRISELRELRTF